MYQSKDYMREMRVRGRRMYWQHKAKQAGRAIGFTVMFIVGFSLFIAVLYGFALVFPD